MAPPQYTHAVRVTLTHAKELEAGDYTGTSDPYFLFSTDNGQSARSSCRAGTLDPVWSPPEHFDFKVHDPEQRMLQVEVFDHDLLSADDLLGSACIPLKDFVSAHSSASGSTATVLTPASSAGFTLAASESVATGALSQVFLQITVTPLDLAEVRLELWENECWMLGTGWSSNEKYLVDHRRRYSTEDGEISGDTMEEIAPKPPVGYQPCAGGWAFSIGKGDREGWLYAVTFAGPWYPEKDATTCVRRRKWERMYRRPKSFRAPQRLCF